VSNSKCRFLIDWFFILPGACLGFGGLWLKMSCSAQDGGLPKGIKYFILCLACAGSSGDALSTFSPIGAPHIMWLFIWSSLVNVRFEETLQSTPQNSSPLINPCTFLHCTKQQFVSHSWTSARLMSWTRPWIISSTSLVLHVLLHKCSVILVTILEVKPATSSTCYALHVPLCKLEKTSRTMQQTRDNRVSVLQGWLNWAQFSSTSCCTTSTIFAIL
jgi:hypothetical protein